MIRRTLLPILLGVALVPVLAGAARAEEPDLSSPRATLKSFVEALNDIKKRGAPPERADLAVRCMNFGPFLSQARQDSKRDRAVRLLDVIDRVVGRLDWADVPESVDGDVYLLAEVPDVGRIELAKESGGAWRFNEPTVAIIPELYEATRAFELRDDLSGGAPLLDALSRGPEWWPEVLQRTAFLLMHGQWIGLLILVILGVIADRILVLLLSFIVGSRLRKQDIDVDTRARRTALRPLGLLAMALVWWLGLDLLFLPDRVHAVLLITAKGLAAVAGVWSAYRLVDLVTDSLARKASGTESRIDDVLVPLLRKSAKVFIAAFGLVFVADNLDVDITSVLAGLGLGGLAFALAARETVANLFGSVTVLLDRPFDIGDWVRIGDVDGNVESIGFRSTRVRTFYNSQITVPNSKLITAVVDNFGARQYRRIKTTLGLTYDTSPEKIEAFCEGVRELIRRHPYTRKDYYHVYLTGLGDSTLDILLYCFVETPDWATELREKHRLFADILTLATRLGVSFAFPTQTLFVEKEPEPADPTDLTDADETQAAARAGRREARAIVEAGLPGGRKPGPVVLGATSLDPALEGRNVGGDEG